jgi:hypothetical protein
MLIPKLIYLLTARSDRFHLLHLLRLLHRRLSDAFRTACRHTLFVVMSVLAANPIK